MLSSGRETGSDPDFPPDFPTVGVCRIEIRNNVSVTTIRMMIKSNRLQLVNSLLTNCKIAEKNYKMIRVKLKQIST